MENSKDEEITESDQNRRIHIGSDELVEILTWLPTKQVVKLSSLNKTVHNRLSTPEFAKTQCFRSSLPKTQCSGGVFLQDRMAPFPLRGYNNPELLALPESSTGIPTKSLSYIIRTGSRILASSQGLLLLAKIVGNSYRKQRHKDFLICNPVTRRCAPITIPPWLESRQWNCLYNCPLLECRRRNLKYRRNNFADGYTFVFPLLKDTNVAAKIMGNYEFAVYRNGKWEEGMCDLATVGERQRLLLMNKHPVCLFNGRDGGLVIHYLCEIDDNVGTEGHIAAYDVDRKAFSRNFKLPRECEWHIHLLRLFKWRSPSSSHETIALVRRQFTYDLVGRQTFTVWVLEDYEGGSWTRMFQKTTAEMGVMENNIKIEMRSFNLVMNATGMGLVFTVRDRVYAYQLDGPQSGRLQVVVEHDYGVVDVEFIHYINTLRPVCSGDNQLVIL